MAFSGLSYDVGAYKKALDQSSAIGARMIQTPIIDCKACLPINSVADNVVKQNTNLVDIDSELMGLNKRLSNCPEQKYVELCKDGEATPKCDNVVGLKHLPVCNNIPTDYTRLSNPSCNIRGIGNNRWESLCQNPQARLEIPFSNNINSRILAKDNHRPCIPIPVDQSLLLPNGSTLPCSVTSDAFLNCAPTEPVQ